MPLPRPETKRPVVGFSGYIYANHRKGEDLVMGIVNSPLGEKVDWRASGRGWPVKTKMYKWADMPQDPKHVPYSAVNQFWHAQEVIDATYRDGGCPNNDTAYSVAWIDVSNEPIILTIPEITDGRSPRLTMAAVTPRAASLA